MKLGNGFVRLGQMFEEIEVNRGGTRPLSRLLKKDPPYPRDENLRLIDDLNLIWSPIRRSDISWNFERFQSSNKRLDIVEI